MKNAGILSEIAHIKAITHQWQNDPHSLNSIEAIISNMNEVPDDIYLYSNEEMCELLEGQA